MTRARNRTRQVRDVGDGRMAAPGDELEVPDDHPGLGDWLVALPAPKPTKTAKPDMAMKES